MLLIVFCGGGLVVCLFLVFEIMFWGRCFLLLFFPLIYIHILDMSNISSLWWLSNRRTVLTLHPSEVVTIHICTSSTYSLMVTRFVHFTAEYFTLGEI